MLAEWMTELWLRIKALTRRSQLDRDLSDELRFHLAMREQKLREQGVPAEEADYAARRDFGNATRAKEVNREMWTFPFLESLWQDLRYGMRQLRRNPGFTAVAVLTLAFGIGANTAIFSLGEAVLFPPFAGASPSRLAMIYTSGPHRSGYSSSSFPDYLYYREHSRGFSGTAAYVRVEAAWIHGSTTKLSWAEVVSSNYFDVLGVKPWRGRFFLPPENHAAGLTPVAVVSYRFWREQMGGTPFLTTHALTFNDHVFTVIGVAPKDFEGVQLDWGQPPDFWFPMNTERTFLGGDSNLLNAPQARWCLIVGRLRPGVTTAQAGTEIRLLAGQLERAYPEADRGRTGLVIPFSEGRIYPTWRKKITSTMWLLSFFAGLVLLVACADVANLLLARGTSRQKEIGVRLALGAGRGRVIRQLLTESVLVSLAGAGIGMLLAHWMARWVTTFKRLFTIQLALHPATLDIRVLAFTVGLSITVALAFGMAPAFQASRVDLNASLNGTGPQSRAAWQHHWLRHSLVIAEISIAFIGIAGAAVLLHTLWTLDSTNLGFDPHHVLSVSTETFTRRYKPNENIRFYSELLGSVSSLAGVKSAALAINSPLTTMHVFYSVQQPGRPEQNPQVWQTIDGSAVSPDYFATLGIPLLRGRDFRPEDNHNAPPVIIVNRTMARMFWPHENPIGRHLRLKGQTTLAEVIGVAADVRQHNAWQAPEEFLYRPFAQSPFPECYVLVRTRGDPMALLPGVRQQVMALDPQVPVYGAKTLAQVVADSMAEPRMTASLVSLFGALVLILAVAGMYSVITYSVAQRTHEIGIRMALGAQKRDVLKMVVGKGVRLTLIGVAIGIVGAIAVTSFLESVLYGIKPTDPLTFIIVSLILLGVALLACYIPARRAAKVDPMVALRHE